MKPNAHVRTAKGYCCVICDGPYSTYKAKEKRAMKRKDKAISKKDMLDQLFFTEVSFEDVGEDT